MISSDEDCSDEYDTSDVSDNDTTTDVDERVPFYASRYLAKTPSTIRNLDRDPSLTPESYPFRKRTPTQVVESGFGLHWEWGGVVKTLEDEFGHNPVEITALLDQPSVARDLILLLRKLEACETIDAIIALLFPRVDEFDPSTYTLIGYANSRLLDQLVRTFCPRKRPANARTFFSIMAAYGFVEALIFLRHIVWPTIMRHGSWEYAIPKRVIGHAVASGRYVTFQILRNHFAYGVTCDARRCEYVWKQAFRRPDLHMFQQMIPVIPLPDWHREVWSGFFCHTNLKTYRWMEDYLADHGGQHDSHFLYYTTRNISRFQLKKLLEYLITSGKLVQNTLRFYDLFQDRNLLPVWKKYWKKNSAVRNFYYNHQTPTTTFAELLLYSTFKSSPESIRFLWNDFLNNGDEPQNVNALIPSVSHLFPCCFHQPECLIVILELGGPPICEVLREEFRTRSVLDPLRITSPTASYSKKELAAKTNQVLEILASHGLHLGRFDEELADIMLARYFGRSASQSDFAWYMELSQGKFRDKILRYIISHQLNSLGFALLDVVRRTSP